MNLGRSVYSQSTLPAGSQFRIAIGSGSQLDHNQDLRWVQIGRSVPNPERCQLDSDHSWMLTLRVILPNGIIETKLTQLVSRARGLLLQRRGVRPQQAELALSVAYMTRGLNCSDTESLSQLGFDVLATVP